MGELVKEYTVGQRVVHINLKHNSIYSMGEAGGTGKTCLAYHLSAYDKPGCDVAVYTFGKNESIEQFISRLSGRDIKLYIFDRADLCASKDDCNIINELSTKAPVLVDVKKPKVSLRLNAQRDAEVEMEGKHIYVRDKVYIRR